MTDAAAGSRKTSPFGFRDLEADEKVRAVRGVFESVAPSYDRMNDLMSGGVHRLWKDAVAARMNPRPGETILDVAGGTGDLARRYAALARKAQERNGGPDASVIVLDYNAEMIRAGIARGSEPELTWVVGDAMRLPLPDASVDAYSIGFGIRNVADVDQALREARRVLKPGGRFLCLDYAVRPPPPSAPPTTPGPLHPIPRTASGWPGTRTATSTWSKASAASPTSRGSRP